MSYFFRHKKPIEQPKIITIPSAVELQKIIADNLAKDVQVTKELISDHFLEGQHPFNSKRYDFNLGSVKHIDILTPELNSLGYEVITVAAGEEIYKYYNRQNSSYEDRLSKFEEYRVIQMKGYKV